MTDKATSHFFEIVAGGRINTPEEWHAYLEAFHAELPDANELFTLLRTLAEATSYDVLAMAAARAGGANILDVGCGDGNLIAELLERIPAPVRITGIDTSSAEIEIARRRYDREPRVTLTVGDARALPYPDAAFDCVVAHQFLNLFPEIDSVLDEIARVLTPGGDLIFVANRGWRADQKANWMLLHEAAMDVLKSLHPQFVWPRMGDMRIYREEGIPEVFAASNQWNMETLALELFTTSALMLPGHIAAMYNRLYLFGTVPEKHLILEAVERRAKEIAGRSGFVEIELPFRLVRIQKQRAS